MSSPPAQTMASTPSKPGTPSDLAKVEAETASEILERYEPSEEAAALSTDGMSPRRFLDRLLAGELNEDAISFLAYGLPRREAVWWGLRCVREITPDEPEEKVAAAIAATDAWLADPTDEKRRAAMVAAEAATYGTPAGCIALAAFFSEGSMAPPDCPPVPVGEWFCARTVAAAVILASIARKPEEIPVLGKKFAEQGIEVANGPAPWEEAS